MLQDQAVMVALRKELSIKEWELGELSCCDWPGVTCAGENRTVTVLDISRRSLRGNISLISQRKSLQRLDLSGNAFHGSIPDSFGDLLELEFLDLSMNMLENQIPASLGSMRKLTILNLSNNVFVGEIPDDLKKLRKLEEFQISSNNLTGSIPDFGASEVLTIISEVPTSSH